MLLPVFQRRPLTFVSILPRRGLLHIQKLASLHKMLGPEQPYLTFEWKKATADLVETSFKKTDRQHPEHPKKISIDT